MKPPLRLFATLCLLVSATAKPTLFIIGDSTVRNQTAGQKGWGDPLVARFDPAAIEVVNRAIGGRSSRTFLTEGRWEAVTAHLRPGDFVLMQFGHNDSGDLFDGDRPRASLPGNGDDSRAGTVAATGKEETVLSFGAYLRRFIADTRRKGATPIVLSPIPRNQWRDGRIQRADRSHGLWARQAAEQGGALFIDFNALLADRYESLGPERTTAIFAPGDSTHPNPEGAGLNAAVLAEALRDSPLGPHLLPSDLWLPRVFGDHMVLQRDRPNPLWGRSQPGAEVTATIDGLSATATAGPDGNFRIDLPALPAGGPHVLEVRSPRKSRAFRDVLVGEVWLCSGQSNMDFTLAATAKRPFAGATGWEREVAAAEHPRIREFKAEWTMREDPQVEIEGAWTACTPRTAGDFSAVAYYFARELERELGVPVGLVTCAYGASTAEAWISREKLAANPAFKPLRDAFWKKFIAFRDDPKPFADYGTALAKWEASGRKGRAPRHPDPVQDQHHPGVLFDGMIAPLVRYGIRGAIWYQGESNVGTRSLYPALQQALIEDWRERWGLGSFSFHFVQLAAYQAPKDQPSDSKLAAMREAQAASLALPNTGMAVAIDLGEEKDIHPHNKRDVGKRLALLALKNDYGKNIPSRGPVFKTAEIGDGRIILHFDTTGGSLVAKDGPLKHFAIAGDDRKFVWADAAIEGDTVIASSPAVPRPVHVRYAWADNPEGANLHNTAGLPAAPFRTDP